MTERTHKEIYDRLLAVETKVDNLVEDSKEVVAAFNAAQGAFTVLGWLASAAKPMLWIAGVLSAFSYMISEYRMK
jgi:hypothetical protein